ncbi:hypothetical protein [Corynebacterium freneyi]|uniref:Uncharacterized protein n=1 Tax=Corynebacterium freneyi TaxID=134034 RepID=A0ABS4U9T8_9CORY|nr:hypothetical protein [Corynebacterium freneyi]MBP2333316.1 hypothetical protein [Corynebacterium freneyi]QXA52632.1 hypothetical protein I6L56_11400 [Corynebacterium freneyi]WJZ04580.1 hypothetical protein CFREN_02970 [Corynebacterium freneyi]
MTDMIPADAVRDIIARHRDGASHRGGMILDALKALLPPPPRPTLADMTDEERAACQWMQADVKGADTRVVIRRPIPRKGGGRAALLDRWGDVIYEDHADVTPRPDLPRLKWPGTEKPAPALPGGWRLADHEKRGRVIVTNLTPNAVGHVAYVLPATDPLGYDWFFCDPSDLTYIDQETGTSDAVPPNTLAVGSEWDDADALTLACKHSELDQIVVIDCDGDASVWSAVAEWWEKGFPYYGFEPYTIIHTGRKADQ